MDNHYILDELHNPILVSEKEFNDWRSSKEAQPLLCVGSDVIGPHIILTCYRGGNAPDALVFQTCAVTQPGHSPELNNMEIYWSWDEAEKGHARHVDIARSIG